MIDHLLRRSRRPPAESIYEHLRAHAPVDRPGLTEGGETLPDEAPAGMGLRIRFAPGAWDGIQLEHMSPEVNQRQLERILRLVLDAAQGPPDPSTAASLDAKLEKVDFIGLIDPLLERIQTAAPNPEAIAVLGRRLATQGTTRNAVKLGISLLGIISGTDDEDVLITLGRHDEFTVYSAVALANTSADPERSLWDLARLVDGWGRIQTVERLRDTRRPEIRAWILREGFRNTVMNEYLAHIAATTGGLLAELEKPSLDDDTVIAACDIVDALIRGGPAEDIDDYDDAPRAMELLLGHLDRHAPRLRQFTTLDAIESFLGDQVTAPVHLMDADEAASIRERHAEAWQKRLERGWTTETRQRLLSAVREMMSRPHWHELAGRGLDSADQVEFHEASEVAHAVGMDVIDAHLRRLNERPEEAHWFDIMRFVDSGRIDEVLEIATRSIGLDEIATGPGKELGFGPEFTEHQELDAILQELRRFPGKGWPLVSAGLRSPVTRNRSLAMYVLDSWNRSEWPDGANAALKQAAAIEPDGFIRSAMQALLRGEPVPEPDFDSL